MSEFVGCEVPADYKTHTRERYLPGHTGKKSEFEMEECATSHYFCKYGYIFTRALIVQRQGSI